MIRLPRQDVKISADESISEVERLDLECKTAKSSYDDAAGKLSALQGDAKKLEAERDRAREELQMKDGLLREVQESMTSMLQDRGEESNRVRLLEERNSKLQAELSAAEETNFTSLTANTAMSEEISKLKAESESKNSDLESAAKDKSQLAAELESMRKLKESQAEELQMKDGLLREVQESMTAKLQDKGEESNKIKVLEERNAKLQAELSTAQETNSSSLAANTAMSEEISKLKAYGESKNGDLASVTKEKSELAAKLESMKKLQESQTEELQKKANLLKEVQESMTAKLQGEGEETNKMKLLEERNSKLQSELSAAQETNSSSLAANTALSEEISKLKSYGESKNNDLESAANEKSQLTAKLESMKKLQESQAEELQEKASLLKEVQESMTSMLQDRGEDSNNAKLLEERNSKLQAELSAAEETNSATLAANTAMSEEISKLKAESESKNSDLESAANEKSQLTAKLESMKKLQERQADEMQMKDSLLKEVQESMTAKLQDRGEETNKMKLLEERNSKLQAELSAVEETNSATLGANTALSEEVSKLRAECESKNSDLESAANEKSQLTAELESVKKLRETGDRTIEELGVKVDEANRRTDREAASRAEIEKKFEVMGEMLQKMEGEKKATEDKLLREAASAKDTKMKMKAHVDKLTIDMNGMKSERDAANKRLLEVGNYVSLHEAVSGELEAERAKTIALTQKVKDLLTNNKDTSMALETQKTEAAAHKNKRLTAKNEMMSLLRKFEAERDRNNLTEDKVKYTLTNQAIEQQKGIEGSIMRLNEDLEKLSKRLGVAGQGGEASSIPGLEMTPTTNRLLNNSRLGKANSKFPGLNPSQALVALEDEMLRVSSGLGLLSSGIERLTSMVDNDAGSGGCFESIFGMFAPSPMPKSKKKKGYNNLSEGDEEEKIGITSGEDHDDAMEEGTFT